jgi:asparagine synthase (glutamine-hydrolysing)
MCGLAGFLSSKSFNEAEGRRTLARMGQAILHRGPDQGAEWLDPEAGIGLASRRLAIIDLSSAGHQPMESASGRYMMAYNGETYNHPAIRDELEQSGKVPTWRGTSDTETLLAGFEAWGIAATLKRTVGMFALAVWDRKQRSLSLARDRVGEKPMYYGRQGPVLLFGSELKALACHPAFEGEIDRDSLAAYMEEGSVPGPRSIYRGIHQLAPGSILTVAGDGEPTLEQYWSASRAVEQGVANRLQAGDEEAVDAFEAILSRAVAGQLIGDVPVGAFLSGGIDSSLITALMQRASSRPVQTFTIGFEDQRFNEAPFARNVAKHLGSDHHELTVSPGDALALIPSLPTIYDEPFADSSQVPTFLISKLARTRVTVALSGDGGDELFAGYDKHGLADRIWRRIRGVPRPLRVATGAVLQSVPPELWNSVGKLAKSRRRFSTLSDQVAKGARTLAARSPVDIGRTITRRWNGEAVVIGATGHSVSGRDPGLDSVEALMADDLQHYLPDDILVKVDRAAMAVSLETRAPYLDHRVVEFAWRLPLEMKLRGRTSKWIMRQLLARYVPTELFDRPKRGFSIPVDEWLRGPLKDWAEELLEPSRLAGQGYFEPGPIRAAWDAHLSGRSNRQAQLWTVLMFQAWLEAASARTRQLPVKAVA